jgi:hypothetical protein
VHAVAAPLALVKQQAGFDCAAAAQLNKTAFTDLVQDISGMPPEDRCLGACQIILRLLAYLFEQQ